MVPDHPKKEGTKPTITLKKQVEFRQVGYIDKGKEKWHTAISFPAFSGLFPTLSAAAAAAPEEMPT